jgi:hypothetical protein
MNRRKNFLAIGMTVLVIGFIGIGSVNGAASISTQANWEVLKQLASGQQIRIVLNDAKSYKGQFQRVSDEELVVRSGGGDQTFARPSILRISTKGASHRGRNALIGAGVGAGVGAAAWGVCPQGGYREVIPCGGKGAAIGAAMFAPMGALVGAVIPTGGWHDVYRVR